MIAINGIFVMEIGLRDFNSRFASPVERHLNGFDIDIARVLPFRGLLLFLLPECQNVIF